MKGTARAIGFLQDLAWENLPLIVQHQAKRCLLDGLGALLAGTQTAVAEAMAAFATDQLPGDQATVFAGRGRASASGAALANAFAANALDIDDGYRPIKGHPGACVIPVILAAAESWPCSGAEFLTALVAGYELGMRAGLVRHATYSTYHASGSWGAVAGAAAAGRLMGLGPAALREAMGTAEYHAPIAPMMKGIAVPSMGKDGIGWGCFVGMASALMARRGFTGVQPLFDDAPDPALVESLGQRYLMLDLYFKPYCACRWAQPAVEGALTICRRERLAVADIDTIEVHTFAEAAALSRAHPKDTEEAQYNLAFPIAAVLIDGEVGPRQVLPPRLFHPELLRLMDRVSVVAEDRYQCEFPARALAEVIVKTADGRSLASGTLSARWDPASGLPGDAELLAKFHWLVDPVLGQDQATDLATLIFHFEPASVTELIALCRRRPDPMAGRSDVAGAVADGAAAAARL